MHTHINILVNAHSIFAATKTLYLNPNQKFGGEEAKQRHLLVGWLNAQPPLTHWFHGKA